MPKNGGRRHINPHVYHSYNRTVYSDDKYEIVIEYIGDSTNTDDDRMRAAAYRTVAALRTPGRRIAFHNWYMSFINRHPVIT